MTLTEKPVKKPVKIDQAFLSLVVLFIATILLAVVSYKSGVNDGMDESERQFKKVLKKMTVVQNKCVNVPSYDCYPIKEFN
jgi:hypothetical protein